MLPILEKIELSINYGILDGEQYWSKYRVNKSKPYQMNVLYLMENCD
jgi:hypothetical protein